MLPAPPSTRFRHSGSLSLSLSYAPSLFLRVLVYKLLSSSSYSVFSKRTRKEEKEGASLSLSNTWQSGSLPLHMSFSVSLLPLLPLLPFTSTATQRWIIRPAPCQRHQPPITSKKSGFLLYAKRETCFFLFFFRDEAKRPAHIFFL